VFQIIRRYNVSTSSNVTRPGGKFGIREQGPFSAQAREGQIIIVIIIPAKAGEGPLPS